MRALCIELFRFPRANLDNGLSSGPEPFSDILNLYQMRPAAGESLEDGRHPRTGVGGGAADQTGQGMRRMYGPGLQDRLGLLLQKNDSVRPPNTSRRVTEDPAWQIGEH